jgi:dTMP kinase
MPTARPNLHSGVLVAIEGIDGSGKGTQAKLLEDVLRSEGASIEVFQFPQYERTFFGREVGRYLHGEYGQLTDVDPKLSALLYSLDRFEIRDHLLEALAAGRIVICDRYTASNVAHQGARVPSTDRVAMARWIEHVEYVVLGLPRPDLTCFLDSSVETSQSLVGLKPARAYTNKSHDLQESSAEHLQAALEGFRNLSHDVNWKTIRCLDNEGEMRPAQDIHAEILQHVRLARASRSVHNR